ncbi:SH3 domain-containing protein [Nonlabens dokdonensis]|uniref:SH3 domain-containing protein n=1 Tax=Nonlabens dokdonensis TaxID=328515 RepID=A0ABX5Q2Z9_9FLAO|nr:SH3 domain-containing protein [Nonlabens dokdonensis]
MLLLSCKQDARSNVTESDSIETDKKSVNIEEIDNKSYYNLETVTAFNGLTLRDAPNLNGQKIGKFKYRDQMEVIEAISTDTVIINDNGFLIPGTFVKVKDTDTDLEGYVFDGFLSNKDDLSDAYDVTYNQEINNDRFLSVYELEKSVVGIVIPINAEDSRFTFQDSLIMNSMHSDDEYKRSEYVLHDNTFAKIYQSNKLLEEYEHYLNQKFFLYGDTNTARSATVIDIGVSLDECQDQFIFLELEAPFDLSSYYFASEQMVKFSKVEQELKMRESEFNYYQNITNTYFDCGYAEDHRHVTLIGKLDNDTFMGYRSFEEYEEQGSSDPYRVLLQFKNGKIPVDYITYLDLFGCACL